jgi:hypothetical protein
MSMWRACGVALLIGLGACGNSDSAGGDAAGTGGVAGGAGAGGDAGASDAGGGSGQAGSGNAGQGQAGSGIAGQGQAGSGAAGKGQAGAGGKAPFSCKATTSCDQITCGCAGDPTAPCAHPDSDCQLDCQVANTCGQANFTGKGGFAPEPPYMAADDKAIDHAQCALQAIAAHTPGQYRWASTATTGSHTQTLYLLAGGLVWVTQENTLDAMTQRTRLGPASLKPDSYFTSCTAATDPTKLFECLENAVAGCQ